jgi:hypothetical protein
MVWEDGGTGVAGTVASTMTGTSKEQSSGDAPPPLSPATSLVSLALALGGVCLVTLAVLGGIFAVWSLSTEDEPTPTTTPAPVAAVPKPMSDVLVDVPPAGYLPVAAGEGPNGPFDLEGLLQFADDPADRLVFERNGFEAGYARTWENDTPPGGRIIASVLEFATAAGADATEEHQSLRTIQKDAGTPIVIPGVRALHFVHQSADGPVYGYAVTIRAGENRLYYLTALYSTDVPAAEITELTRQQQLRLNSAS